MTTTGRSLALLETPARTPPLAIVLGYGPMALLPLLAVISTTLPPLWAYNVILAGHVWAAALLLFLGGVRRGLSFVAGGERPAQVGSALAYFAFGFCAILIRVQFALLVLIVGYALVGVLDRRAAKRREVPRYFARLRPMQAVIAIAGIAGLLARLLTI